MNALWKKHPATAREIAERLPKGVNWAYTTIKTMLTRLAEKKALRELKKGGIGIYEPILTRHQARKSALAQLVGQAFDGAFGPLMHFLLEDQELSASDRDDIIKALRQSQDKKKGTPK